MNMEILHKAKRKDNGEWVEGYYHKRYGVYGELDCIFWSKAYNYWECIEVDPETVCAYTGKNDISSNTDRSHDCICISA